MMLARTALFLAACVAAAAQTVCPSTPVYSPCEMTFDLSAEEAKANPNPYRTVELEAEFRSPRFRTFRVPAFWDGNRLVLRFTPTGAGDWDFRVTSNIKSLEAKEGRFTATESNSPGRLKAANVHHWALVDGNVQTPHLWMGDMLYPFAYIERPVFEQVVAARAAQKFNHLRGLVLSPPGGPQKAFPAPDRPDGTVFREMDDRVKFLNGKGIIADLILASDPAQLTAVFPSWQDRERYVRYLVARYAGYDVTWQLVDSLEGTADARSILKEIGTTLKKLDPYQHPRSAGALATSSPFSGDEWMSFIACGSGDDQLGSIEHQLFAASFVNVRPAVEDNGAGGAGTVNADKFRHRIWNAAMDGQYPTFANSGTSGAGGMRVDPKYLDSPAAKQMTVWYDFFASTRHWELEPYFDVDGGRAVALERPNDEQMEGIEYIVYLEKPGPVEILLQKHGYDAAWINPIDGQSVKIRNFKADRFSGEPPDKTHDWVLHISREGRKEGMLRSYKFESRAIQMQEIEQLPARVPFEIAEPASDSISMANPPKYAAKVTRETRNTHAMSWLWMGEVAADQQGARVLGSGQQGTFSIAPHMAAVFPANVAVRLYGMNAKGKVYSIIRIYQLSK